MEKDNRNGMEKALGMSYCKVCGVCTHYGEKVCNCEVQ